MCTLSNFASNIGAGVVSAALVLLIQHVSVQWRNWTRFGPMAGDYEEEFTPNHAPTGGTIRIMVHGTTLNVEAINKTNTVEWRAKVHMSTLNPDVGEGTYLYEKDKTDSGVLRIQRLPATQDFIVRGSNTSDPRGVDKFNTLWRARKTST
jgi:hypothetical protein